MDRDKRWERVALAYAALTEAQGEAAATAEAAVAQSYAAEKSDEFVLPTAIDGFAGMRDGDGLLLANFPADRAREILTALLDPHFDAFAHPPSFHFPAPRGMNSNSTPPPP